MRAFVLIIKQYGTKAKSNVTGTVRIKLEQQGTYKTITHNDDLKDIFRDEYFTLPKITLF